MQGKTNTPVARSWLAPLLAPVEAFFSAESAGAIVLMAFALAALLWANSSWGAGYQHFWHAEILVGVAGYSHAMSLEHCVNDGLMALFFLLVGLEIKRELLLGELASIRRAALPIAAACGGMIVPALIYHALNPGGAGVTGWGIPMATDIAFAVGVLALVGSWVPSSVKVFLLAVAIVDDLGAVLVIAIFYTRHISGVALLAGAVFLIALIGLNILRVQQPWPYILLGVGLWAATLFSGIHATIAGVLLAFTIPATHPLQARPGIDQASRIPNRREDGSHALQTPLARVERALLMPVNFLIMPLFALANAGVDVRTSGMGALTSPISWGILLGLCAGKPIGVLLASWIALKARVASLPTGATLIQIIGVSVLCGIGFTMSLFIANLAFPGHMEHLADAKIGILAASLVSGIVGGSILALARAMPVRQESPVASSPK